MIIVVTNYEFLTTGVHLSNISDVIANSISITVEGTIVNIRDWLGNSNSNLNQSPGDTYTETQVDAVLINKSDKFNTYTKPEVDNQFANLTDGAPAVLDTRKEFATGLGNANNYAINI